MKFILASAKLTGSPDSSGWAQVHEYEPEDKEKLALRGKLFAVISMKTDVEKDPTSQEGGMDTVIAGREILARLHEEYFGNTEAGPFNALKEAVNKVVSQFSAPKSKIGIGAVVYLEDALYVVVVGGVQAWLLRGGMLAKILESKGEKAVCASGYPQAKDVFLLGTKVFFEILTEGIIKAALEAPTPAASMEILSPIVHSEDNLGALGAGVIKFEKSDTGQVLRLAQEKRMSFKKRYPYFVKNLKRFIRVLPERKIFIKPDARTLEMEQKRKTAVSVGLILLFLLAISIFLGVRQRRIKQEKARYESKLSQAQHEFTEAQSLVSLNPGRARELLISAREITLALKEEGIKDANLDLLLRDIGANMAQITGIYQVEPDLFLDLSILSKGLKGDDLVLSKEKMLILDQEGERLVGVQINNKRTEVLAGPDLLSKPLFALVYSDRNFVVSEKGVWEVNEEARLLLEADWQGEILPYIYGGNVYVLDKQKSLIWRYPGLTQAAGGGFAAKQNWLGPGVKPDLSDVLSWTIDGSIWILNRGGRIMKFSHGKQDSFSVSGLGTSLISVLDIYTNEELSAIYLLDPENSRIVVFSKDGQFRAEYVNDKIHEAKQLVVSEKDKKIIILEDSKLYSIKVEHL